MKKNIRLYFESLSFSRKMKLSTFFIACISLIVLLILNLIFGYVLSKQIYENNHDKISFASTNLYEQFEAIEHFSYKLIGNEVVQTNLAQTALPEQPATEKIRLKQKLQAEVNNLVLDEKHIKSVFLINSKLENQVNFIANTDNILADLSVSTIVNSLSNQPSKGQWFFSENFNRAVYARKIFSKNNLALDYLGTIFLTVDTSFIQTTLNERTPHSNHDLFILNYQNNFYTNSKISQTDLNGFVALIKHNKRPKTDYAIDRYAGKNYFIVSNESKDQAFAFYSLIPNKDLIKKVTQIELIILFVIVLIFLIVLLIINHYISSLISPINNLAKNMKLFQKNKDFNQLKEVQKIPDRTDEIGTLYDSYQIMIDEIEQLIQQNYQGKILAQEIQFQALQAQLDPHFLYNTLDSINWLALSKGEEDISKMVTSLAFLFKKKIDNSATTTTLEEELELINAYIDIQSIRFQTRFTFISIILIDDLNIEIPKLIIQPLIENSIKYAVEKMTSTCLIQLKIFEKNQQLMIIVTDNGPGFDAERMKSPSHSGIGLKNIASRLTLKYGDEATLTIRSEPYKETEVILAIPKLLIIKEVLE